MPETKTARGIQNISGVSCHISCALQVLGHVAIPLWEEIWSHGFISNGGNLPASSAFLLKDQLGFFLSELCCTNETPNVVLPSEEQFPPPMDPTMLYQSLERLGKFRPHDVGDVSTAIYKLIQILRHPEHEKDGDGDDDLNALIDYFFMGGETMQIIQGIRRLENSSPSRFVIRTKARQPKRMAVPFPLIGRFKSIEDGLKLATKPLTLQNYSWERQDSPLFKEEFVDSINADDILETTALTGWVTRKETRFDALPRILFLSLERFGYDETGSRILTNPSITIPTTLKLSEVCPSAGSILQLQAGVLHVQEEGTRLEEEGHYVTLVRQRPFGSSPNNPANWLFIDDESCESIVHDRALELLSGATEESGQFYCGTLLAYGPAPGSMDGSGADREGFEMLSRMLLRARQRTVERLEDQRHREPDLQPDLSKPHTLVGRRLSIRWAKCKYYQGLIESYDPKSNKHRVRYDDGDIRDYILAKKNIHWL